MHSLLTKASSWREDQDGERSCGFVMTNQIVKLPFYYRGRLARPDGCGRLLGHSFLNYSHPGFMQSVVQCLAHIPPFVEACLDDCHSAQCQHMFSYPPLGIKAARGCKRCGIECQIAVECRAFGISTGLSRDLIHTSNPWFAEIRHLSWMQCDSAGALALVLQAVEKDENAGAPQGYRSLVGHFFNGVCQSRVTCTECGSFSDTREPFKVLPLDIKAASTVPEAMEHFFRKIRLTEAYKCTCGACKKRVDAEEQLKLLEAPNILILQIKRFDFNGRKNTKIIEFNLDLDLAPYMAQNIGASQDTRYTLSGVLSAPHSDIQSIDHHSACVRSLDGDWRVMARKEVIKVTKEQLKQREAYFLFYVQDGAKPPPRSPRPAEPILSGDCMPLSQRRPSMRAMAQQATTVLSPPLWGGAASISPLLQQSPAAATPPSPLEHLVMAAVPPPSPLQQSPAAATPPSPLEHPVMAAVPPPSPLQQSPAAATPPSPLEHPVMAAVPPPSPLQQSPAAATPPSPLEHPVMAAVPPPSPLQQIMAEMSSLPQRSVVLEKSIEVQLSFHPGHEEADGDSTSTAGSCSTRPHVRRLRPIGEIRVDIRRVLKEVREQRAKGMAGAVASTTSAAAGCDSGCGDLVHPAADATASHKRKFEESDSGNGATGVLGRLVKISRLERVTTKWALPPRGADYRTCKNGDIV